MVVCVCVCARALVYLLLEDDRQLWPHSIFASYSGQKRRSNRVVKRKKYTEDLDIKITDDEDEQEDVDVTTTAAAVASISGNTAAQLKQEMELDGDGQPSMQFFVVSVKLL